MKLMDKQYVLFILLLSLFFSCKSRQELVRGGERGIILNYTGYTASFNPETKLPNWVIYELTAEETKGTVKRNSNYYPDPSIKVGQADNNDYRNSIWDRGHMVPAGDMKWSKQAML